MNKQNEWLLENRAAIDVKIQRGIAELDRGEGIPEDELDAYLDKLKAQRERAGGEVRRANETESAPIAHAAALLNGDRTTLYRALAV